MPTTYDIGDIARLSITLANSSGTATDPTTLSLAVRPGNSSTTTTYTYALSEITKSSTGSYYKDVTITEDGGGVWYYKWTATGTVVGMQTGQFYVRIDDGTASAGLDQYCGVDDVFSYCRDILSGSTAFSSGTLPPESDVRRWMNAGYSRINRSIAAKGYSVPAASSADIFEELGELQALYAGALAHRSRNVQQTTANATTKGDRLMAEFKEQLGDLLKSDLSYSGLTYTGAKLYAGGISIDDKQTDEADTDRVEPAFTRALGDDPEINWPTADTDDEEES